MKSWEFAQPLQPLQQPFQPLDAAEQAAAEAEFELLLKPLYVLTSMDEFLFPAAADGAAMMK